METSKAGVDFVKRFEGKRLVAYQDIVGKWTVGYGHLIRLPQEAYFKDVPITEEVATLLLVDDLRTAEACVNKHVTVKLDQEQFDALVSFVYNLGCGAFERSTLLAILNTGDKCRAAEQFVRWNKAGGQPIKGLTTRREAEKRLFLTGEYNV
jgi:lysozyme